MLLLFFMDFETFVLGGGGSWEPQIWGSFSFDVGGREIDRLNYHIQLINHTHENGHKLGDRKLIEPSSSTKSCVLKII